MITQFLLWFFHDLAVGLFGWLSAHLPSPPAFWTDATSAVTTVFGMVPGPVRYFVPIGPVVIAGTALVTLIAVLGALRLARRVVSLFTGGGGMA